MVNLSVAANWPFELVAAQVDVTCVDELNTKAGRQAGIRNLDRPLPVRVGHIEVGEVQAKPAVEPFGARADLVIEHSLGRREGRRRLPSAMAAVCAAPLDVATML